MLNDELMKVYEQILEGDFLNVSSNILASDFIRVNQYAIWVNSQLIKEQIDTIRELGEKIKKLEEKKKWKLGS